MDLVAGLPFEKVTQLLGSDRIPSVARCKDLSTVQLPRSISSGSSLASLISNVQDGLLREEFLADAQAKTILLSNSSMGRATQSEASQAAKTGAVIQRRLRTLGL